MRATVPMTSPRSRTLVADLRRAGLRCEVLYLHAEDDVLLRRYAETRRRHPLAGAGMSLADAIAEERRLLHPLIDSADLVIDTSRMSVHALRDSIAQRVEPRPRPAVDPVRILRLQARHAGRRGFRVRRAHAAESLLGAGAQAADRARRQVVEFLEASPRVDEMLEDLVRFIEGRLPDYEAANRGYLTVAIGCTGGQHRSVYLVERLAAHFRPKYPQLLVRHNALPQ